MRTSVPALIVLAVLGCATGPASAADPKTFDDQAEAWCRWQGGARPARDQASADKPWVYGCTSHVERAPGSHAAGKRPEGRILWDKDSSPAGRPRLR